MTQQERKRKYRCRYCKELVGCSEQGVIGMYSMKILRKHEKECIETMPSELNKS